MAQETKRDQPVRLPNPSAQPFVTALKTIRFYAILFFWVTMLCVLAYVAAFVLTEWIGLYDAPPAAAAEPKPAAMPAHPASSTSWLGFWEGTALGATKGGPSFFGVGPKKAGSAEEEPSEPTATPPRPVSAAPPTMPTSTPTAAAPPTVPAAAPPKIPETEGKVVGKTEAPPVPEKAPPTFKQQRERAEYYLDVTVNILRPLRIIGVLSSFLLAATLFLYLQITLLGRLGGIRQLTNALFLLLLFMGTVVPWENIFEGFRVNVFYDFARLVANHAARVSDHAGDFWAQARYFSRFFALPFASVLLLAWSGIQFAAGYRESVVAND